MIGARAESNIAKKTAENRHQQFWGKKMVAAGDQKGFQSGGNAGSWAAEGDPTEPSSICQNFVS